jgi:hypothetical protein
MLPSDKKAVVVFLVYATAQLVVPIALFRGTLGIKDALWFVGTVAPVAMGMIVLAWFVVGRSMRLTTVMVFGLGLACLGLLNHWLIMLIEDSC